MNLLKNTVIESLLTKCIKCKVIARLNIGARSRPNVDREVEDVDQLRRNFETMRERSSARKIGDRKI